MIPRCIMKGLFPNHGGAARVDATVCSAGVTRSGAAAQARPSSWE